MYLEGVLEKNSPFLTAAAQKTTKAMLTYVSNISDVTGDDLCKVKDFFE